MSLHGNIQVNYQTIGEWSAQRAGTTGEGDYVYRCKMWLTEMNGYTTERMFFVRHSFKDGAVALTARVMLGFELARIEPKHSEPVLWYQFCTDNNLNPVSSLEDHITLKE